MRISRRRRLAAIGVAGVAIVSGALIAVTGSAQASSPRATTTAAPNCNTHDDPWPAWTQGQPTGINLNTAAGVYMWHDVNGWHIRVTHRTDSVRSFSGQLILTNGGTFAGVTPVKLEAGDSYVVSANKHTVSFLFLNYGHIDGLNFFTHCATQIQFAFQSDGVTVPPAKIIVGKNKAHPYNDPFIISRLEPPPTTTTMVTTTTAGTTTSGATTTTGA